MKKIVICVSSLFLLWESVNCQRIKMLEVSKVKNNFITENKDSSQGPVMVVKKNPGKGKDQDLIVKKYINKFKDLAVSEMLRTGVPASIKLAQGIVETKAGNSELVSLSNNHFGIKCKSGWTGEKVYYDDDAKVNVLENIPRKKSHTKITLNFYLKVRDMKIYLRYIP